jgi:DNA (cytosine-5)-methyltransferase 1
MVNYLAPTKSYLTAQDHFAGCGGGAIALDAAGIEIVASCNHNRRSVESHEANFQHHPHYLTDITKVDPAQFMRSDIAILTPECKFHTSARGKKLKGQGQLLLWDDVQPDDPNATRSRMLMNEVLRFAEYHRYWALIVENVVDCFMHWAGMPKWLKTMHDLGYDGELVCFNSQFAPDYPYAAPQSRDRGYHVFWQRSIGRKPNLDLRPPAYCDKCGEAVNAIQSWKDARKPKIGKWRQQYVYRCPHCAEEVRPHYRPVWTAIDWMLPIPTIGERKEPLEESTLRRVRAGMQKFGYQPTLLDLGLNYRRQDGTETVRAWPMTEPSPAQTSAQTLGFLVPMAYDRGPVPLTEVSPAMTARNDVGLAVPYSPFLVEMHGTSTARSITEPCGTVCSGGNHHGIVAPAEFAGFLSSYYSGSDQNTALSQPCPTVPTVDRHALVEMPISMLLEDVRFRMLDPDRELKCIMGFPPNYVILGNKREQTQQLGNSLTPPVVTEIVMRVREILAPEVIGKTLFPIFDRGLARAA